MTVKNYAKVFNQLESKPVIKRKYIKHNAPKSRTCGFNLRGCRTCGRHGGLIHKYGIELCRQCFRETAKEIGFKKFS